MDKPNKETQWHGEKAHNIRDPAYQWLGTIYVSNDLMWIWKKEADGPGSAAGWVPNLLFNPQPQNTNQNQYSVTERTDKSMLNTVAVTTLAIVKSDGTTTPEKLVAGPDNTIIARDVNSAILLFGAKNAEKILAEEPGSLVVQIRQGV
jgi:hypothetical protein